MSDWKMIRPGVPVPDGVQERNEVAVERAAVFPKGFLQSKGLPKKPHPDGSARPVMIGHNWWGALVHGPVVVGDTIVVRSKGWGAFRTKVTDVVSTTEDGAISIVDVYPPRPEVPELPALGDDRPLGVQQEVQRRKKALHEATKEYGKRSRMYRTKQTEDRLAALERAEQGLHFATLHLKALEVG